uniref:Uncharacterized protein n=1 Tax=Lygus hesperus TaxID=30085 RepID=A0A0K8SW82_LYGHE
MLPEEDYKLLDNKLLPSSGRNAAPRKILLPGFDETLNLKRDSSPSHLSSGRKAAPKILWPGFDETLNSYADELPRSWSKSSRPPSAAPHKLLTPPSHDTYTYAPLIYSSKLTIIRHTAPRAFLLPRSDETFSYNEDDSPFSSSKLSTPYNAAPHEFLTPGSDDMYDEYDEPSYLSKLSSTRHSAPHKFLTPVSDDTYAFDEYDEPFYLSKLSSNRHAAPHKSGSRKLSSKTDDIKKQGKTWVTFNWAT